MSPFVTCSACTFVRTASSASFSFSSICSWMMRSTEATIKTASIRKKMIPALLRFGMSFFVSLIFRRISGIIFSASAPSACAARFRVLRAFSLSLRPSSLFSTSILFSFYLLLSDFPTRGSVRYKCNLSLPIKSITICSLYGCRRL